MSSAPDEIHGAPLPGHIVAGKYRVERLLGAGGMGVVLAAWHLALERRVALKLLRPEAAELPGAVERFLREGRAAARLESDHIARVLDVGVLDDGAPYLVLEYLHGTDLDAVLEASGRLELTEAIDYLLQAGEAIAEAHARGILHRDLKLKNLYLAHGADGSARIKVLDFGLSKIRSPGDDVDMSLTSTGLIMGSIQTMAPEQLRGLRFADARSDLWALGVMLYQLVTGRLPFSGDSIVAISAAITVDKPAPLSVLRPDLPRALDAVMNRCLAKDPAARFQRMGELARAVAPFGSARARRSLEVIRRLEAGLHATLPAPSAPAEREVASGVSALQATAAPTTVSLPRSAGNGRVAVAVVATLGVVVSGGVAGGWALGAGPLARSAAVQSVAPLVIPQLPLPPAGDEPRPAKPVIGVKALPDVVPPKPPPTASGNVGRPPASSVSAPPTAPARPKTAPKPPQRNPLEKWD